MDIMSAPEITQNTELSIPSQSSNGQDDCRAQRLSEPPAVRKRHKCPYCSMDFTRHYNLKSHLLTHIQEDNLECSICQEQFRRPEELQRHEGLGGCAGCQSSLSGSDKPVMPNKNGTTIPPEYTSLPDFASSRLHRSVKPSRGRSRASPVRRRDSSASIVRSMIDQRIGMAGDERSSRPPSPAPPTSPFPPGSPFEREYSSSNEDVRLHHPSPLPGGTNSGRQEGCGSLQEIGNLWALDDDVHFTPHHLQQVEPTVKTTSSQKFHCHFCIKGKAFTREDARKRHMRVCHPGASDHGKRGPDADGHDIVSSEYTTTNLPTPSEGSMFTGCLTNIKPKNHVTQPDDLFDRAGVASTVCTQNTDVAEIPSKPLRTSTNRPPADNATETGGRGMGDGLLEKVQAPNLRSLHTLPAPVPGYEPSVGSENASKRLPRLTSQKDTPESLYVKCVIDADSKKSKCTRKTRPDGSQSCVRCEADSTNCVFQDRAPASGTVRSMRSAIPVSDKSIESLVERLYGDRYGPPKGTRGLPPPSSMIPTGVQAFPTPRSPSPSIYFHHWLPPSQTDTGDEDKVEIGRGRSRTPRPQRRASSTSSVRSMVEERLRMAEYDRATRPSSPAEPASPLRSGSPYEGEYMWSQGANALPLPSQPFQGSKFACSYGGCFRTFDSLARAYEHEERFHRSRRPSRSAACLSCQKRRIRCSGERPVCQACLRLRVCCVYKRLETSDTAHEDTVPTMIPHTATRADHSLPGQVGEHVVYNEQTKAIWDPSVIFDQWNGAFGGSGAFGRRNQDQSGLPASANHSDTSDTMPNHSGSPTASLTPCKTESPFIDRSHASTQDCRFDTARTPSLSPPYMRPASTSPSRRSRSSDRFKCDSKSPQKCSPVVLPHSARQTSGSLQHSTELPEPCHQHTESAKDLADASMLPRSVQQEAERMSQSREVSESSRQHNDYACETNLAEYRQEMKQLHEETEARRTMTRLETSDATNDTILNAHSSASTRAKECTIHDAPEEWPNNNSRSQSTLKDSPENRKRRSSKDLSRAYPCETCGKTFTRRNLWDNHQRTHTNERPFICSFAECGKTFKQKNEQTRHEQSKHQTKRFVCGGALSASRTWGCGKRFARSDGLLEHHTKTAKGRLCLEAKIWCLGDDP